MVFIDGENLVIRFQETGKETGRQPQKRDVFHEPDSIAWSKAALGGVIADVVRATYYTSAVGSDERIDSLERKILELEYSCTYQGHSAYGHLVPKVFKKLKNSTKSRQVDINITIDAFHHAASDHYEVCVLMTGDGDFVPLVQTIQRCGKRVVVAAFTSGLATNLQKAADDFYLLDDLFFAH